MLVSKNKILSFIVLLVFLFSTFSFSTDVSAKKPIVSDKEKKKVVAEIKKVETSNKNLLKKTKDAEKKLVIILDEFEYTYELIQAYEDQTGDLTSFKEAKTELESVNEELTTVMPDLYIPHKMIASEIKIVKAKYKKQSYKTSTKQIKGIKKDISESLDLLEVISDEIETETEIIKEAQNMIKVFL